MTVYERTSQREARERRERFLKAYFAVAWPGLIYGLWLLYLVVKYKLY